MFAKITNQICALLGMIGLSGYIIAGVHRAFETPYPLFYITYTIIACWMLMYMDNFYKEHLEWEPN